MSKRSLKTALAVSIPPAPLPMRVCSAAYSVEKVIAFRTPLTHKGLFFGISVGLTADLSPSIEPISLIVLPLFDSFIKRLQRYLADACSVNIF